jgi:hypothetical protein
MTKQINAFLEHDEQGQDRILRNTVRELTVWLKAKRLYNQALKETFSLKLFKLRK